MKNWKTAALLAVALLLAIGVGSPWAQGAVTRVMLMLGSSAVSASNPLPVTLSGGSGGEVTIADGDDATQGAIADAAATQGGTGTISAKIRLMTSQLNTIAASVASINTASQYPVGAIPITASATGTTGVTTATLAAHATKTTYICGYSIRANATAATTVTNTITGVITGTLSSIMWVAPLASGLGIDEQIFSPCIPGSATNTAISIASGAPGSGGSVSSKGWGYQL